MFNKYIFSSLNKLHKYNAGKVKNNTNDVSK